MIRRSTRKVRNGKLFLFLTCCTLGCLGSLSAQGTGADSRPYTPQSEWRKENTAYLSRTLTPRSTGSPAATLFRVQKPPVFAVKTNLMYWAAMTPNLGFEIGLGQKTSLEISGAYNPWEKDGAVDEAGDLTGDKKLNHWLVRPEFKYWLSDRFSGHYFGLQAFYVDFDIHGYKIPTLLDKEFYNDGTAYGGGVTYGYHWLWSRRWGMEFNVGAGVIQMDYKEKTCNDCEQDATRLKKTYVGPISAGIKLVFIIR